MLDPAGHKAIEDFAALDLAAVALLLDVDGTLIDLGPAPFEVHVPGALCRSLERLLERTGGALALVSGRPVRDIDKLFSPLTLPVVGGHGAEMRLHGGETTLAVEPLPEKLRNQLVQAAKLSSGVLVEDKGYSVALHYRQSPQEEPRLRELVTRARAAFPGEPLEVLLGKAMFEIKRSGISKGDAVRKLMKLSPFADRAPVFIGDDVTDESVFAVLPALRGKGYSVARKFPGLAGIFSTPDEVRAALSQLSLR
jgi:trehalose 6-phosphate phosphatase